MAFFLALVFDLSPPMAAPLVTAKSLPRDLFNEVLGTFSSLVVN